MLPADTADLVATTISIPLEIRLRGSANPALAYAKYALNPTAEGAKTAFQKGYAQAYSKHRGIQNSAKVAHERRAALCRELDKRGFRCWGGTATTLDRLAIGLGNPHPHEANITLSWLYGFPEIPSSSLRGVVRHHALAEIAQSLGIERLSYDEWRSRKLDDDENAREKPVPTPLERLDSVLDRWPTSDRFEDAARDPIAELRDPAVAADAPLVADSFSLEDLKRITAPYRAVFGNQHRRGRGIFFNAIVAEYELELDIVNPHHTPYYEGRENAPPADWYAPKPHTFLVIKPGAVMKVAFAVRPARVGDDLGADDLRGLIARWATEVFRSRGVGAKTTLGYGRADLHGAAVAHA
jgi:CRISPR-associated protein Cmr6